MRDPCVYLLASHYQGTPYCGVTSDLVGRVWQHRSDLVAGSTRKYAVHDLVWYEQHATMDSAISREKAIKEWKRAWKVRLIERSNPAWRDLYAELLQPQQVGKPRRRLGPGLRRGDEDLAYVDKQVRPPRGEAQR